MNSHIARDGRRRRVLHEEARTAAGLHASMAASTDNNSEAPRYGEMASVEHHPQITDYVPRRKRAVLATLAAGGVVGAAAAALTHGAEAISRALPGVTSGEIRSQIAGGIVAWTSAVALLAIAGLARLVFSLRRHRVDDVGGRYRVWTWIAAGGVVLSVNAMVAGHAIVSRMAVAATGWSLTASGAEWWLAPLALVGGWIGVRLVLELAESRGALTMFAVAAGWYLLAAAGSLGWSPAWLGVWSEALASSAAVVGHAFALAGMMAFARYVVLDVQGLIDHNPRRPAKKAIAAKTAAATVSATLSPVVPSAPTQPQPWTAAEADEDEDASDDAAGRYLSKSERKRLRKQQRRAA